MLAVSIPIRVWRCRRSSLHTEVTNLE